MLLYFYPNKLKNLFDIVKKNHGEIPEVYQKKVANLILKLDETGVFHGDPNPKHCSDPWCKENWK